MDEESKIAVLKRAYAAFNIRDIDSALAMMQPDVEWPNGTEGGTVHGRAGVREYWTRRWGVVDLASSQRVSNWMRRDELWSGFTK
jgi:ketosteroid isomerase-like protein